MVQMIKTNFVVYPKKIKHYSSHLQKCLHNIRNPFGIYLFYCNWKTFYWKYWKWKWKLAKIVQWDPWIVLKSVVEPINSTKKYSGAHE